MIRIKEKAFADKNLIEQIARTCKVSQKLGELLVSRGVNSVEDAYKLDELDNFKLILKRSLSDE